MSKAEYVTNDTLRGKPKAGESGIMVEIIRKTKNPANKQTIKNTTRNDDQNVNQICKQWASST